MNDSLTSPISDFEIKAVVDSMGATKAPSPDGVNGMFFQKNWEVVGREVCAAVHRFFFNFGVHPGEINETMVALIPKVPQPECINQLRQINCCNFIYKVISKLIVLRLKPFMGRLVTFHQSVFVGGRLIQDNLVVVQEVFHALKDRSRGGRIVWPSSLI